MSVQAWYPAATSNQEKAHWAASSPLRGRAEEGGAAEADSPNARTVAAGVYDEPIQINADPGPAVGSLLRAGAAIRLPKQIAAAAAAGARVHASAHRIRKPAFSAMDVQVSHLAARRPLGRYITMGTAENLDRANAVLPHRCLPARSSHLRA